MASPDKFNPATSDKPLPASVSGDYCTTLTIREGHMTLPPMQTSDRKTSPSMAPSDYQAPPPVISPHCEAPPTSSGQDDSSKSDTSGALNCPQTDQ